MSNNKTQDILDLYKASVMPTYAPSVVVASGKGVTVRDVDGRMAHSLLLEIFTREGVGTEITE